MTKTTGLREGLAADRTLRAYNDKTLRYIMALESNSAEYRPRENALVILDDKGERVEALYILPSYERVDSELLAHKQPGESYGDFAKRMNLSSVELSQLRSPSNPRALSRDLLLNLLLKKLDNGEGELMLKSLLDRPEEASGKQNSPVDRVNHLFMELKMPDLFIGTYDRAVNCRNFVIAKVISAAAMALRENDLPDTDWEMLLQRALLHYGMEPTRKDAKAVYRSTVRKGQPPSGEFAAAGEELELFESWREELAEISAVDYTKFRRELLGRLKPEGGTDTAVFSHLHGRLSFGVADDVTYDAIKGFFGETMDPRRNKTGRHTLIRIGIAMGCTLAQINRMLRETNEACVYPLSSWELERQYADHIAGKAPF